MKINFKEQRKKFLCLFCIITLLVPVILGQNVQAAVTDARMLVNGDFEFKTTDTAATSNITWETIGFTVRRDISNGNPHKDNKYAEFMIKPEQKKEEANPDGTKIVTFYLTKKQINDALKGTDLETIKDNDELYINGIFRVHNGTNGAGPYYTLNSIKNAEAWKNPNDFNDRFDVRIVYKAGNQVYPVTITYQLYQSGTYTTIEKTEKAKLLTHETFTTNSSSIPTSKTEGGKTYHLYRVYYQDLKNTKTQGNRKTDVNPNIDYDAYLNELSYVRNRTFYMQGTEDGDSLNIVAVYRNFPVKGSTEGTDEIVKDYEEINPTGEIKADARGIEAFDVEDGIPGTERVYANVLSSKYIASSTFQRIFGKKVYNVKVSATYYLYWEEKDPKTGKMVPYSSTVPRDYYYQVEREYSYWIIQSLGVYAIDKAIIVNGVLPGGSVTLTPTGYSAPTVSYVHSSDEKGHLVQPADPDEVVTVSVGTISVNSDTIPLNSFKDDAEEAVKQIKCKNDSLTFNGETIMSPTQKEKLTEVPKEIPSGLSEIGPNVLYRPNLTIPGSLANGEYDSTGTIYYKAVAEIDPVSISKTVEISDINSVVVHTPVVCDGMVEDNRSDNQMINPDAGRASLVLDRPFHVTLPTTGLHRYIKGYGYRDYSKYISGREVKFAFDVYKGGSSAGTFIPKNIWTSIGEDTLFYVPTWVPEGRYEIRYRSIAINAAANNSYTNTEQLANLNSQNYIAEDNSIVQISGRIYGLGIYDVTDYPIWEKVFRLPNSLKLTGFRYTVGTRDQNGSSNGQNPRFTLTMVNGSHPVYKNQGILKTGYMTRFSLTTVGSMAGDRDYVSISPNFYFVDGNGRNRQAVDIYYSETFHGKENTLVRMGSSLDVKNIKSLRTGDPYLGIPEDELKKTAALEGIALKKWKAQEVQSYSFMNIMLPPGLRTLIGPAAPLPPGVTESQAVSGVQKWYGEYYLPAEIHIVQKGYDVMGYASRHGGIDYQEAFWLKEGYIIVNFDIITIRDGVPNLSYINSGNSPQGYCNMWKREGYRYEKESYGGIDFNFLDGDYVIYYANHSVKEDWISAGTH